MKDYFVRLLPIDPIFVIALLAEKDNLYIYLGYGATQALTSLQRAVSI